MKFLFNLFSSKPPSFEEEVIRFFKAIEKGHISTIEKTIDKYPSALKWKNAQGDRCALVAIENNQFGSFECLLSKGIDINAPVYRDEFFTDTALHYACENGKIDLVRFLLDRNADKTILGKLDTGDKYTTKFVDKTAEEMAEYKEHYNIINLFTVYADNEKQPRGDVNKKALEL